MNTTFESITALADGEISENDKQKELQNLISSNSDFEFEFNSQSAIKQRLSRTSMRTKAPDYLKIGILNQIEATIINEASAKPKREKKVVRNGFTQRIRKYFVNPIPALSVMLMFGISGVFQYLRNPFNLDNLLNEYKTDSPLLTVSEKHFGQVLNDEPVHDRLRNVNLADARTYFDTQNLDYKVELHDNKVWKINSVFICDCSGKNVAHSVFNNKKGKTVHLIQLSENELNSDGNYLLGDNFCEYLKNNNFLKGNDGKVSVFVWKAKSKFFTLYTNDTSFEAEDNFIPDYI